MYRVGGHRDLAGRIGVGDRVDVRRVLRPDDDGRLRCTALPARPRRAAASPDVVVEHRAPLRVELRARAAARCPGSPPRRRADRHRRPTADLRTCGLASATLSSTTTTHSPGSTTAGGPAIAARACRADTPAHASITMASQAEAHQHHRERHQRRAAAVRDGQQRAVGLTESDDAPRESTERHDRLQPLGQRSTRRRTTPAIRAAGARRPRADRRPPGRSPPSPTAPAREPARRTR